MSIVQSKIFSSSVNQFTYAEGHTPIVTPDDFFAPTRLQTRSIPIAHNCIAACGSAAAASEAFLEFIVGQRADRI